MKGTPRPKAIRNSILIGDVRERLRDIPDNCVDTIITSSLYFRLCNYQHDGLIALKEHVDEWVAELRSVARELARVPKPTASSPRTSAMANAASAQRTVAED